VATLVLTKVFVNLLSTGEALSAQSTGRSQAYGLDGEVRTFAGGRQRFVGKEGEHGQFTVTLRRIPLTSIVKLRTWQGLAVQFRDRRGQLFNGVFTTVNITTEWKDLLYDVEIPLRMISVDEGV
jgi:hypothetical protein